MQIDNIQGVSEDEVVSTIEAPAAHAKIPAGVNMRLPAAHSKVPEGVNVRFPQPPQQVTAADFAPKREGIFATATDPRGGPAFKLTPETRVVHHGIGMTLERAESLGIVRQLGDSWEEVSEEEQDAREARTRADAEERFGKENAFPAPLPQQADNALTELYGAFKAVHVQPEMAAMDLLMRPDAFKQNVLPKLEKHLGYPAAEIMAEIEATQKDCVMQLAGLAKARGFDMPRFQAFLDWIDARPRAEWASATLLQLKGLATGWNRLLGKFEEATRGLEKPKLPEHIKVGRTADGREYIFVKGPGGESVPVSLKAARLQGLL